MTRTTAAALVIDSLLAVLFSAEASRQASPNATTAAEFKRRAVDASFESGSPDGSVVLYRKDSPMGRVYARDLATNQDRVLIDLDGQVGRLTWSPDSRHVAFTFASGVSQTPEIRIVTIATGATRTLGASGSVLAWTTKDEIFFTAPAPFGPLAAFRVRATGGAPVRVLWGWQGSPSAIMPDGSAVILRQGQRLLLHDLATHFERTITAIASDERLMLLSPDGRMVAFASNQGGDYALYVVPIDRPASMAIRLTSLEGFPARIAGWWTTGGVLAVTSVTYAEANIFRIDLDARTGRASGPARRLTQGPLDRDDPIVSPDASRIAFFFGAGTREGVGTVGSDGATERRTHERPRTSTVFYPVAWRSPNELLIFDAGGMTALDPETGVTKRNSEAELTSAARTPVLTAEGIVYVLGTTAPGNQLRLRSLSGGGDRVIATVDYVRTIAATADGRNIAYVANVPGVGTEIRLLTIDGVRGRVLVPGRSGSMVLGAWSPDGKYLLYFGADNIAHVLNVATLESWPLLTSEADRQIDWSDHAAYWSPNGSFIAQVGNELRRVPLAHAWEGVTAQAVGRILTARRGKNR